MEQYRTHCLILCSLNLLMIFEAGASWNFSKGAGWNRLTTPLHADLANITIYHLQTKSFSLTHRLGYFNMHAKIPMFITFLKNKTCFLK